MNKLLRSLIKKVGMAWVTGKVRDAAEGKLGPKWKAVYWATVGKKRVVGVVFAIVAGAAEALGYREVAVGLVGLAGVAVSLGIIDSNWRSEQEAHWLKDHALWKLAANNAPMVTSGLLAALAWLSGDTCTYGEWCARGVVGVTVLGAVLVQVGLIDAAWKAPAPSKDVHVQPERPVDKPENDA